ncbi:metallophosphoesterase [Deinococcus multiflagellatus]|uniref:Metallophosphoesterase n=1 Tax=Deinococcus multiflagellatus TaxID=1656887 RepID=A0ABW1ZNB4_9DEIO|nr:metallophosphoesterase [Deinococcus multiflagellatus]MBZ9714220.1 metallophosphoesterase [Deinococcus multiflagellatus]
MTRTPQRSVVLPDVHGCPQFLDWAEALFPGRHFILLGDLIHRGPDSRACLKRALAWATAGRAVLLWGNHEDWVWKEGAALSGAARDAWFEREEAALLQQYEAHGEGLPELVADIERFAQLARPYYVEEDMLCAHAARPSLGRSADELLDRGYLLDTPALGLHPLPTAFFPALRYSVHGHAPQKAPVVDLANGVVYLDLGTVRTGQFCAWDAETQQVYLYPDSSPLASQETP